MGYSLEIVRETEIGTETETGIETEMGRETEIGAETSTDIEKATETKIEKARRWSGERRHVSPLGDAFILVPNQKKGNKKTPRKWRSLFVQFTASCLQLCKSEKSYGKRC